MACWHEVYTSENSFSSTLGSSHQQQTRMARDRDRAPMLDMNHGFVQSIIKNQIDRDEYDKDQKVLKLEKELSEGMKEERKRKERRAPIRQVYVPPHMRKEQSSSLTSPPTETSKPELLLRLEFEAKDGKMSYLNINRNDDLKQSVRQFAAANGLDSRLRDALYHKLYLELRET